MKNIIEREVDGILTDILDDYKKERAIDKNDIYNQPDKNEIIAILDHLMAIVYPGFFREKSHKIYNLSHTVSTLIEDVLFHLNKQIMVVMKYTKAFSEEQEEELEEGSYYVVDILGCKVNTDANQELGKIVDVFQTGSNDVYVVKTKDGKEVLLPSIEECILDRDIENKIVKVHIMKGLLD